MDKLEQDSLPANFSAENEGGEGEMDVRGADTQREATNGVWLDGPHPPWLDHSYSR